MRDYSRLATTAFARQGRARTVLVVGAGALGNEVVKNLALVGVERIIIVDRDHIERSNLTRSVLFCTPDIEEAIAQRTPKAVFLARRAREINPDVDVLPIVGEIADLGLALIRRVDVVLSCVDNEMARLELGWACTRLRKPVVDGGLGLLNYSSGQVSVFPGDEGPCYACRKGAQRRRQLLMDLQGHEDPCWRKEEAQRHGDGVATTPVMASVIGAFQVEMALRGLRDGFGRGQGRAFRVTLHPTPSLDSGTFERSPSCPLHDPTSFIGDVVSLPTADVDAVTPRALCAAAGMEEGSLVLDWPLTATAVCRACGHRWEPLLRRARFRHALCPSCGDADLAEVEVLSVIAADSPWATRTCRTLGLPHAHIFEVLDRDPAAPRRYVEMTQGLPASLAEAAC